MYFEKDQSHSYQKYKSEKRPPHGYGNTEPYPGSSSRDSYSQHGHGSNDRGYGPRGYPRGYSNERDRDYKDKYLDYTKEKHGKDGEREHGVYKLGEGEMRGRSDVASTSSRGSKYDDSSSGNEIQNMEWSVHISSSGKRYYYNSMTEVSQWEKPRDWFIRSGMPKEPYRCDEIVDVYRKDTYKFNPKYRAEWNANNREEDRKRQKILVPYEEGDSPDLSPDRSQFNLYQAGTSKMGYGEKSGVPDNSDHSASLLAAAVPRIRMISETVTSASLAREGGPPTPTHSETSEQPHVTHLDTALPRKMESLGTYSSVVGNLGLQPAPMLTPSLVNYVRNDLTAHVTGWPSELLEREAKRCADEAYILGCLQCTRESAQLKCTRSVVRHREIQGTIQEQKILYVRQQISELERYKSQKSMLTED